MIGCGSSPTRRSVGQISKLGLEILFWGFGRFDTGKRIEVRLPTWT